MLTAVWLRIAPDTRRHRHTTAGDASATTDGTLAAVGLGHGEYEHRPSGG